jgi:hypothetical protein
VAGGDTCLVRSATQAPTNFSNLQSYPDVKMCSGVEACRLIGAPDDYEWDPTLKGNITSNSGHSNGTVLFVANAMQTQVSGAPVSLADANLYLAQPVAADTNLQGWFWVSERCPMLSWAAESLTQDMQFEVKVVMCIEAVIEHGVNPSVYRPFVTMPPPEDRKAIDAARDVLRAIPPSIPTPSSGASWWSTLTSMVTGVGDVLSSMGIPFVSAAAGLASKLARVLG